MPSRVKRGQVLELTPEEVGAVLTAAGMRSTGPSPQQTGTGTTTRRATARAAPARAHDRPATANAIGGRAVTPREPGVPGDLPADLDAAPESEGIEPGNSVHGLPTHGNTPVGKFFSKSHGKPHGRPQGQGGPRRGGRGQGQAGRPFGAQGRPQNGKAAARPAARRSRSRLAVCDDDVDGSRRGAGRASRHRIAPSAGPGSRQGPEGSAGAAMAATGQIEATRPAGPGGGPGKKRGRGNRHRRGPNSGAAPGNGEPRAVATGRDRRRYRQSPAGRTQTRGAARAAARSRHARVVAGQRGRRHRQSQTARARCDDRRRATKCRAPCGRSRSTMTSAIVELRKPG